MVVLVPTLVIIKHLMKTYSRLIIVSFFILLAHIAQSQDRENSISFNFGANFSHPTFIDFNTESFQKTIPSWQFSFNKEFLAHKSYGLIIGSGLNRNSFNARRQIGNLYSTKQINLAYLSFEGGPFYKLPFNKLILFTGTNFRISRILSENYGKYYTGGFDKSDIGLNFRLGTKFTSNRMKPYILVNYYWGLTKLVKNFITTGNGEVYKDYLRNRSLGLQVGFYF